MDKAQFNERDIEDGNSTYVGDTSAKGLMLLFWGSNAQNGLNNQDVGEENKDGVHSCSSYEGSKSQNTFVLIVRTWELDYIRMETVRMMVKMKNDGKKWKMKNLLFIRDNNHMVLAKGQSFKKQNQRQ